MTLSTSNPRARQRWGALAAGVAVLTLLLAAVAQGLSQTDFELDKNATNDLTTQRIGALSGNITATATSFTVCQLDPQSTPPSFTIQIGAEQMTVTGVTGTGAATGGCPSGTVNKRTYAVTRGANGTTARAHAASGFEGDITKITVAATDGDDWDQVYNEVQDDANRAVPVDLRPDEVRGLPRLDLLVGWLVGLVPSDRLVAAMPHGQSYVLGGPTLEQGQLFAEDAHGQSHLANLRLRIVQEPA